MSFEALARIRGVDAPGPSALLLLFILAEYAGPDGSCWPSQATLSERSKLSVRAVRDNLHALEEAGLIAQVRRTRKNGERASNQIRLLYYVPEQGADVAGSLGDVTEFAGGHSPAAKSAASLDDGASDQRQQTPSQPAMVAGLTSLEPVTEPITLPSKRVLDDAFAKWSEIYPRKGERANARRIFEQIVRSGSATIDELLSAAQRYAIQVHGTEERWIKNPTTWLHGECWRDAGANLQPERAAAQPEQGFSRNDFAGPAELRAAAVETRGEAWVASWLDPCGWDPDTREIRPRLRLQGDRIRQELSRLLREFGVSIGQPQRA